MIKIIDDYICKTDSNGNYILQKDLHKINKKTGDKIFQTIGFYRNLKSAINGLKRYFEVQKISENNYELDEAIKMINENTQYFEDLLNNKIKE